MCGKIYPVPTSPVSIVGPADVPNCTTPSPFLSFVVIFFLSSFLPFFLIHIFAGPRFHDSPPDGFPRCTPDHNRVRSVRPPRRIYCGRHSERSMTCFILFYYSFFFLSFYVTFEKKRKSSLSPSLFCCGRQSSISTTRPFVCCAHHRLESALVTSTLSAHNTTE